MLSKTHKNRVNLLNSIAEVAEDLCAAMSITATSPKRWVGARMYVLYCFDLRLGQFVGAGKTRNVVKLAVEHLADQLAMDKVTCSSLYNEYFRAFYEVEEWFHSAEPTGRDESVRGFVFAERIWEVISNGPEADVTVRSDPNTGTGDPGGTLSLLHLTQTSVSIANFCKVLAENWFEF